MEGNTLMVSIHQCRKTLYLNQIPIPSLPLQSKCLVDLFQHFWWLDLQEWIQIIHSGTNKKNLFVVLHLLFTPGEISVTTPGFLGSLNDSVVSWGSLSGINKKNLFVVLRLLFTPGEISVTTPGFFRFT